MAVTISDIIDFENGFTKALVMIYEARDADEFQCPEGVVLLMHYEGLLRIAHARGRKTRRLSGMEELGAEIREAITQWADRGELRPAGDPGFEALLKFYREA